MWTEFTREKPARRGLALLTTFVALAGTTGLAWTMTSARAAPTLDSRDQFPPGWPFAFTLPSGYSWSPQGLTGAGDSLADGNGGLAAYLGETPIGDRASLVILYGFLSDKSTPELIRRELSITDLAAGRPIRIGPIDGHVVSVGIPSRRGAQQTRFLAGGSLPVGLAVRIDFQTTSDSEDASRAFEELCRSVTFKDWWIEP